MSSELTLKTQLVQEGKWKQYPVYRDSGVEWLGEVPEHWIAKRLKYITTVNDETLSETTDPDFELVYVDIGSIDSISGIRNKETMTFENTPSRARRKVRNGDVIISTVRTYLRAISPVNDAEPNMVVSTGFAVIRPKENIESQFAAYTLRAPYFVDEVVANSVGVSYPAINASELITFNVALPPLPEQRAIAAFLDHETGRIDTLIEKKERQIELLQEKRAAVISHTVTKGLDPDVEMKDSGVEWLGKVPGGWKVAKLGFKATVKARLGWKALKAEEYVDEGFIFLATPNIKNKDIDFDNVNYITAERYYESPEIMLQEADVLIVKDGSTLGITNVIKSLPSPTTVNSSIAVIRSNEELYSIFLYYILSSIYTQNVIQKMKDGQGVPHLFQADIRKFWIWLPSLEEQRAIAAFLDRETGRIDTLKTKIRESTSKLREYRTALISAAVTGKIDLRQEAA